MNKQKILLISIMGIVMIFSAVAVANATSNYYLLTCPTTDVSVFSDVTVTARSDDGRVETVTFYWFSPDGYEFHETVDVHDEGTDKVATSTHNVDLLGYWTVAAVFRGNGGAWWCNGVWKLRCCHFNVIPEVPLIGTVGASAAMALGLAAFKLKRKPQK